MFSEYQTPEYRDAQHFEDLLREGITALKSGDRQLAQRLLNQAALIQPHDARTWLWLSGTTSDPVEQRSYLERAVAAEPGNANARRGLLMLNTRLGLSTTTSQGQSLEALRPGEPLEAQAQVFLCPKCGGHMQFDVGKENLTCQYCGFVQVSKKLLAADSAETPIDDVLPTERAHRWAEAQHRVGCERCGAITLLPPKLRTDRCPYCGSNRLIESPETAMLVDPQVIVLVKVDERKALGQVRQWLGNGLFAPSDLALKAGGLRLRPAFYPVWTFDGTLEIPWSCEVNEGSGDMPNWVRRTGAEYELFDDVLVPGMKALELADLASVEPFNLKDVVDFKPEYVAGWHVLSYDCSLSDASLRARERVVKKIRQHLYSYIEPGSNKRGIQTGAGQWSDFTFKHLLLPLWVGTYVYQGKDYRLLVNGQTGKVGGKKPRDNVKVFMVAMIGVILSLLLVAGLSWLVIQYGGGK